MTPAYRFSATTRTDLLHLLSACKTCDPAATVRALEAAVERYRAARTRQQQDGTEDRRLRAWARTLGTRLEAARTHLRALDVDQAEALRSSSGCVRSSRKPCRAPRPTTATACSRTCDGGSAGDPPTSI